MGQRPILPTESPALLLVLGPVDLATGKTPIENAAQCTGPVFEPDWPQRFQSRGCSLSSAPPPLAVTAVHAVRLNVAALAAHVGAKLQRAVAWVRRHELELHRP